MKRERVCVRDVAHQANISKSFQASASLQFEYMSVLSDLTTAEAYIPMFLPHRTKG